MWTNNSLEVVYDNQQYVGADGTTYPCNFPKEDIPELFPVALTTKPDETLCNITGFYIDETHTQVWNSTPLTQQQIDAAAADKRSSEQAKIAEYITTVKDLREKILNRIAGIATAAMVSGDTATTASFLAVRQRLLDIIQLPSVATATDLASLTVAVKTEYASIVSIASPSLVSAFNQVNN